MTSSVLRTGATINGARRTDHMADLSWTTAHTLADPVPVSISPLTAGGAPTRGLMTGWRWLAPDGLSWLGYVEAVAGSSWIDGRRIQPADGHQLPSFNHRE